MPGDEQPLVWLRLLTFGSETSDSWVLITRYFISAPGICTNRWETFARKCQTTRNQVDRKAVEKQLFQHCLWILDGHTRLSPMRIIQCDPELHFGSNCFIHLFQCVCCPVATHFVHSSQLCKCKHTHAHTHIVPHHKHGQLCKYSQSVHWKGPHCLGSVEICNARGTLPSSGLQQRDVETCEVADGHLNSTGRDRHSVQFWKQFLRSQISFHFRIERADCGFQQPAPVVRAMQGVRRQGFRLSLRGHFLRRLQGTSIRPYIQTEGFCCPSFN